MPYTTIDSVKAYLGIDADNYDDDEIIGAHIAAATQMIDTYTRRTFESFGATERLYSATRDVDGYMLWLDADLADKPTTVTNGDGQEVTTDQYTMYPINDKPYFLIALDSSADVTWTYTDNPEGAISVIGHWCYSITPDDAIVHTCVRLSAWMYRQRENRTGEDDRALVVGNATILPAQIPTDIQAMLMPYQRIVTP